MDETIPVGPIALDDTLGAAFLGHFVTTLLYGITTLQAFLYYRNSYNDPPVLKLSVFVLWILDSIHVALITGAMYWYCVTNFTNLAAIQQPFWPIPTMIIVSNLSNGIVRGCFAYRLYRLSSDRWILPGIIALCSVFILVDALYFTIEMFSLGKYTDISRFSWSLYSGLSVEAAVDLLVAISQCILLRGFETGIRSTDTVIHMLMTYSVNTGLLTSLCALGALISYAVMPTKFVYFAFYFALSKLYVNSLLATLNARGSLLGNHRRRRQNKGAARAFPTPTDTLEQDADGGQGAGEIEFTTVISVDPHSVDSIVETTKTKIDEESFSYGPSIDA